MKNLVRTLLIPVVVLCALACTARAQSVKFNAIGSSAIVLEVGEAAYSNDAASCAWSQKNLVIATDTSTGSSLTDTGNSWVVWVPPTGSSCASNVTPAKVYGYLQTDSVVGNRCLFNAHASGGPFCSIDYSGGAGTSPLGLIEGASEVSLPTAVATSLTGTVVNAAGTDIRPEDALFAVTRALTPCGSTTTGSGGSIAPFLGLGYSNGGFISSHFSSSKFYVINFSLPPTYFVQPIGFDPIVVAVNSTDPVGTGFNNPTLKSVSKAMVAEYLDGSVGTTAAAVFGGTAAPTTVIVREPLSGTYNTMEYNAPNTRAMQTSQDVGVMQLPSQVNCSGSVPASDPMAIENTVEGSWRYRAIGTGESLKQLFLINNALGYAFWGVSNFAAAPSTARYLEVDGVDPIMGSYQTNGAIPVTPSALANVTFANVQNGTYPIWSLVRLVTVDSTTSSIALSLAQAAAKFSTTAHPDFLPYYTPKGFPAVNWERSHFAPPGITFKNNVPANHGNYNGFGLCTTPEAGGDVGGVILRLSQIDQAYCKDTGIPTGITERRY